MNNIQGRIKSFWKEEDGLGTLELLLILAVIVIIAIAFRKWIFKWVEGLFHKADENINDMTNLNPDSLSPSTAPSTTP